MTDDFYFLKEISIKKVKDILVWAKNNALKIEVDMLKSGDSVRRIRAADKSFGEVLKLITTESLPFFRIIYRKEMNLFGILYDELHIEDILEISIRSIDVEDVEYFIFIYLDKKHIKYLKQKYEFEE